jgi:hypothetical protein
MEVGKTGQQGLLPFASAECVELDLSLRLEDWENSDPAKEHQTVAVPAEIPAWSFPKQVRVLAKHCSLDPVADRTAHYSADFGFPAD